MGYFLNEKNTFKDIDLKNLYMIILKNLICKKKNAFEKVEMDVFQIFANSYTC